MMFGLVETITLNAFSSLYFAQEYSVSPLPAVFALEDTRIHICTSNSSDVAFYIEASINQLLHFLTTLNILNVYPDDGHIWFGRKFDNM